MSWVITKLKLHQSQINHLLCGRRFEVYTTQNASDCPSLHSLVDGAFELHTLGNLRDTEADKVSAAELQ